MKPSDGTGEPQQLTNLGGQVHVNSWSPDGSTLAVHHHSGQTPTRILMLSLDSADAKPRLFYGGSASAAGNPDFSPDGRYVAYQSSESGAQEIYIRPYSGAGGHKPVSVGGGREHRWTKAGELFYRSRNGDRMMTVAVTTEPTLKVGIPVQLFEGAYYSNPSTVSPQYDVTSDGQRIVIVKPVASADALAARPRVVVVLNALTN